MKNILFIAFIFFLGGVNAQTKKSKKVQEVVIMTSAECDNCKDRLEEKLNYTKGIKYAELDVKSQKLTVGYSPKKINVDKIKNIISETGYDADEVKANLEVQKKLPACCQPGGH